MKYLKKFEGELHVDKNVIFDWLNRYYVIYIAEEDDYEIHKKLGKFDEKAHNYTTLANEVSKTLNIPEHSAEVLEYVQEWAYSHIQN